MLGRWVSREHLNAGGIGVFGFSVGGLTALIASGGAPNLQLAASYCRNTPNELACKLGMTRDFGTPAVAGRATATWVHDSRIKAAVVVAPGLGFAFDRQGLAGVHIPIQLWAASEDRNAPYASNAAIVQRLLPRAPDFQMVEGVGHFAFARPCNPELEPQRKRSCVDSATFNQSVFHEQFNRQVKAFFDAALLPRKF